MLGTPATGVGGVHADHRDAAPRRHRHQPIPKPAGGDTGHTAAQSFAPFAPPKGLAPGSARVGEVQVLHHHRRAVVLLGATEQRGDRRAQPPITP